MEDTEIIALYFKRQESAIAETGNKYGAYLNAVAYHILNSPDDTEEIVNDTYMAAWNTIPPTRPENLKHFLSRITRNLSFDRLDYKKAQKRYAQFVELDECIPDRGKNPETAWESREIGRVLNQFLETLEPKTCALFLARYYYAYSMQELAEHYGLPVRRVKYLLQKTRKYLRLFLEKEGVAL